ncbi:MAG: YjjI family glycine radical enzyme, partial [Clostridiales bacterium]|nr:YjjI family glycine radical enzyme [Clostridiales bacterium]
KNGCKFLGLAPPNSLDEALNNLLIFYKNVPSVTNYPVYIGNLDTLLEPFVQDMDYEAAKKAIKLFLMHIDRTIPDAFCHADIGPKATLAGRVILECERELENAVPNMTILYDKTITDDSFAKEAILTQLKVAKPAFANHKLFEAELGKNYAVASCYNGLIIKGGAYTLTRLLLSNLAKKADSIEGFFSGQLPECVKVMLNYMDERVNFIVNESGFFETNFLVKEGFVTKGNFTAMFGIVGLAECVNTLLEKENISERYGHSETADNLGVRIMEEISRLNGLHENKHCLNGKFLLHGQVGIDTDVGSTPNVRIPIGEEPAELSDHIMHCAKFQKYFPSGVGEIFLVESTALKNPDYILDIYKGAFDMGCRYLSFHDNNSDVIRVTGYLVKRSEMQKLENGEASLAGTTTFGLNSAKNIKILERMAR